MPNWTWNRIKCKKHIGDQILTKINNEYSFDFNKLIKMPEELNVMAGSQGDNGLILLYIGTEDESKRNEINKAYRSLNPFFTNIFEEEIFNKFKNNYDNYKNDPNFKEAFDLGEKYLSNYNKYGYCNWYTWCTNNWGTKGNVENDVDVEEIKDEYIITFYTAWSAPHGIIDEYSKLCKDGELCWEYEDEDDDKHHMLVKENGIIYDLVGKQKNDEYYDSKEHDDFEL